MKNSSIITSSFILGSLVLVSCSTNKLATSDANDNLYFMASDAKIATEYAVQNNNPEQFQTLSSPATESIPEESFSSRNVNPDYIARYQAQEDTAQNDIVYFDEAGTGENSTDIDAYNNYRVGNSGTNSNFNSSMAFNMGMMYGMSPFGMGGFYNPYMGYGSGINMSLGFSFGFGNPFYRPMYYRPGYGMAGFYDPWGPVYGYGYPGYGYPGYGYGYPGYYATNPIYILPGGEYGDRRVVTGARPTRGSSLAVSNRGRNVSNAAIQPSTARAQARRDVLNSSNSPTSRRIVSNSDNSRVSARDFSSSQNDYYNSRTRAGSARNVSSAAIDRPVSRTRSAMPSARPSVGTTNTRTIDAGRGGTVRNSYPSNSRSASPSYNRSNVPSRTSSPSYNRGGSNTNTRTVTPARTSRPSNNTPSFSTPSRSSGSSVSTGGASRSTSTPSRGGRGN